MFIPNDIRYLEPLGEDHECDGRTERQTDRQTDRMSFSNSTLT